MDPSRKPQRARAARKETSKTVRRSPKKADASMTMASDQRQSMIAQFAYFRAERRGFRGGDPVTDWLESEKEVDALLSRSAE